MPLNPDGSVACLFLPIRYDDGDGMHIYVEQLSSNLVRFYDGGDVVSHFAGRGLNMADARKAKFIKNAADPSGVKLNDDGELEIYTKPEDASQGFASFLHTLTRIRDWESANFAHDLDEVAFLDEVEHLLRKAYPKADVGPSRSFTGITGQEHALSFSVGDEVALAVQSHHASISAALRKMLDIKANPSNASVKTFVILDDRRLHKPSTGLGEAALFQTFGPVLDFTRLKAKAERAVQH